MPSIVILKAGESMTHDLSRDETVIGRHPECQIQIDSNMVSRKHARVFREGSRFLVEDLGSGNGTTVNGVRIVNPTPLAHDDRVKLGPILIRFVDQAGAQSAVASRASGASPEGQRPGGPPPAFKFNLTVEGDDSATITGAMPGSVSSTRATFPTSTPWNSTGASAISPDTDSCVRIWYVA
jgi:pSer/pThr/pTyr-binding forkhead associated (FHA) protein